MREIASVYAARTKRRLIIGCISALVGLPAMACCLTLVVTVLFPALDNLAAGGNQNNAMVAILGVGALALAGLFAFPLGIFVVLTIRRPRALDAIFKPMGLTGQAYMLNGRHYQGQINGRGLDVYIYRGPTVEFRLKANVQTRLQVLPAGGKQNKAPLAIGQTAQPAFSVYPTDEAWAQRLLADVRTPDALQTLMTTGADWAIFRRVEILAGEVLFHLNRSHSMFASPIEPHTVQVWLNALQAFAQAAEEQPAPEISVPPAATASTASRQKLSNVLVYSVVAIVFIMPMCFIAVGGIAYLVVTLMG